MVAASFAGSAGSAAFAVGGAVSGFDGSPAAFGSLALPGIGAVVSAVFDRPVPFLFPLPFAGRWLPGSLAGAWRRDHRFRDVLRTVRLEVVHVGIHSVRVESRDGIRLDRSSPGVRLLREAPTTLLEIAYPARRAYPAGFRLPGPARCPFPHLVFAHPAPSPPPCSQAQRGTGTRRRLPRQ